MKIGMDFFYQQVTYIFDTLHRFWEHEQVHKKISVLLVFLFLFNLLLIELNRQQILPPSLATIIPTNHFHAIATPFTIILILEILSLIFVLPCSFSLAVGKQFELLALILLRDAFKELSYLPEPISFLGNEEAIMKIMSDGFGSLIVFGLLGVYYMVQKHSAETGERAEDLYRFVASKKSVSLFLLGCFIAMGADNIYHSLPGQEHTYRFFQNFYTLLIVTDILIVLISQCFLPSFFSIFRNSGYALSTMFIRLALVAPAYYNVLMGIAAISFAIILTLINNRLFPGK
jgi:hypothetical protein